MSAFANYPASLSVSVSAGGHPILAGALLYQLEDLLYRPPGLCLLSTGVTVPPHAHGRIGSGAYDISCRALYDSRAL